MAFSTAPECAIENQEARMYRYKRLLVEITLTAKDASTIPYAGMISRMAQSEKVYFVHVPKTVEIPEEICCEYPELLEPLDEAEEHLMEQLVREHFEGNPGIEIAYQVREGTEVVEVLRWARTKNIDLVIVGTERSTGHRGTVPEKLARKAHCSVLVIPEGAPAKIEKILVPVDFSEHTADAVDVAIAFATAAGMRKVQCLHTYHVPPGFHKTGKTHEEFAKIMLGHAEKKYHEIMSNMDTKGVEVDPIYVLDKKPIVALQEAVKELKPDLVIMAAKGRSPTAAIFLGSVTEQGIHTLDIPLIAVKRKGEGLGFLDALLKI
jgi:nucleotide-binding universal stress UspA family protein